jgi:hypothetical protein
MIWFWFPLHEHWPVYLPGLSPQVWSLVSCFCMNSCFSSFCSIFLQEKVEAQTGCQLVRLPPVDGRILPGYLGLRVSAMVALPRPGGLGAWGPGLGWIGLVGWLVQCATQFPGRMACLQMESHTRPRRIAGHTLATMDGTGVTLRCTGWLDADAHCDAGTRLELLDSKEIWRYSKTQLEKTLVIYLSVPKDPESKS